MISTELETGPPPPDPRRGPKHTVMICDDQEDIVYVCEKLLGTTFDVLVARSGEECLTSFAREAKRGKKVDVLLLDYRLGDMLGNEVVSRLKGVESARRTKIILITAFELDGAELEQMKRARENDGTPAGSISVLRKPFRMAELRREVVSVLGD